MPTKVRISGEIQLASDYKSLLNQIKAANTYPNPNYNLAIRYGFNLWNIPKEIFTYRESGDWLLLPRGYWHELLPLLPKNSFIEDWTTEESTLFSEYRGRIA
jgi:hypothetical protein